MTDIIDCFIFYNEVELLLYRLSILDEHVKYFVIIEATHTFAGHPKTSVYLENIHLFDKFKHKIIHKIVSMLFIYPQIHYDIQEQWENERHQRDSISRCVTKLYEAKYIDKTANIIISDVDEIVDPNVLKEIKEGKITIQNGLTLPMDMYYYNLTCKLKDSMNCVKIVSYDELTSTTCNNIRFKNVYNFHDKMCGWHLSYFGDPEFIRNKITHYSHQEYNTPTFKNPRRIGKNMSQCVDLFDRPNLGLTHVDIKDNTYLPPQYEIYLSKYC